MIRAIDLFAGFGGFSQGAAAAGVDVVYTANHWQLAVAAHAMNHPTAEHVCQDLNLADWSKLPEYDLLLAAPCCQPHSNAAQPKRKTHKRYHDAERATPWCVVDCVEQTMPRALIVENVPQFRRWVFFDLWTAALRCLGYTLTERIVDARAYGVPQRRRRIFITGTLNGQAVELDATLPRTEPAFGDCVDWTGGPWRPLSKAKPGKRARIAAGHKRFGRRARFIVQDVTGHRGIPVTESIRTITGGDQWAVVDGNRYRPLTLRENARAMGFDDSFVWPDIDPEHDRPPIRRAIVQGFGNAVCPPVARGVIERVAEVM